MEALCVTYLLKDFTELLFLKTVLANLLYFDGDSWNKQEGREQREGMTYSKEPELESNQGHCREDSALTW